MMRHRLRFVSLQHQPQDLVIERIVGAVGSMAASHAVEWIDLKGPGLCSLCRSQIFANNRK